MSKKMVFVIIGLASLAAGVYSALSGMGIKAAAYALLVIGAFLFLGPILGMRKLVSLFVLIAVSAVAYFLVCYLLGALGLVFETKGKTAIAIVTFLSVYILGSSFEKRT